MGAASPLPSDFDTWTFEGGSAAARRDVAGAVRSALEAAGSLHRWAASQPARRVFTGRGETYGVALGGTPAVVRHARHGGLLAPLLGDLYLGRPRFYREAELSRQLRDGGVRTPAVLAGVRYAAGPAHRADVATEQVNGRDLVEVFFGESPAPAGPARTAILEALGHLVRRLHDLGYVHPDLQLRNLVVSGGAANPISWLLDVDTCRRMRGRADAERARNLERFYRSWAKWNHLRGERLTAVDKGLFSAAYLEGEP